MIVDITEKKHNVDNDMINDDKI